jgi:hypothetical protein
MLIFNPPHGLLVVSNTIPRGRELVVSRDVK